MTKTQKRKSTHRRRRPRSVLTVVPVATSGTHGHSGNRGPNGNRGHSGNRGPNGNEGAHLVVPCLEDSLTDVLHMRNVHGRVRKVLTVDQYLHHKRYKGKNAGLLTARGASGTVYTLPVDPKLAATPADPFRTAGATASS